MHSPAELDDLRLTAMLAHPHAAHAIAELDDADIDAIADAHKADPEGGDDDADDTDLHEDEASVARDPWDDEVA